MSIIVPFRAVRFPGRDLTRVICPPYDVISEKNKAVLLRRSPGNMVRLELPDAGPAGNKYASAAALYRAWICAGVLARDDEPAYYVYEQRFSDQGRAMVRRGFFAALKVENPFTGGVKPHERTLAKPKEDRLKMLRAVRANLSPIFGLYHDTGRATIAAFKRIAARVPDVQASDDEATRHRLWAVRDPRMVALFTRALSGQDVFIADGHHRYETSWNYLSERKAKGTLPAGAACGYVLAFLCPMQDPGLSIWPTHRVVKLPADFEARAAKYFTELPASRFAALAKRSPQPVKVYAGGKVRTFAVRSPAVLAQFMPGRCAEYRNLGVSILHSILLAGVPPEDITYVKDEREAVALARSSRRAAIIVPATPIDYVRRIALAGQTMPQKSTYFFPKAASGLVIHPVSGKE